LRTHKEYTTTDTDMTDETIRASALHTNAWGRRWPHQAKGTILKTDIDDEKSGSIDDDVVVALADILKVPSEFNYDCFKNIQEVKRALGGDAHANEG